MKRPQKILISLLLLIGGAGIVTVLVKTREVVEPQPAAILPSLVEVVTAPLASEAITIEALGTVIPAREVALQPEVSGRLVMTSPQLLPGGRVREGEVLARIDRRNYDLAVAERAARVAEAELQLALEKGRAEIAEREWALINAGVVGPKPPSALTLRRPQMLAAQAGLEAAKGALERARLDAERTIIRAPFDALITEEDAELGQIVQPQSRLATLVGTRRFYVRVSLPLSRLARVRPPDRSGAGGAEARVFLDVGDDEPRVFPGRVARFLGDLDAVGRLARVLIAVDEPLGDGGAGARSLLIGAFVRVAIEGPTLAEAVALPRRALRGKDQVWVMGEDEALAIRRVKVLFGARDQVLVEGALAPGERVIVSRLSAPIAGMKLRLAGAPMPAEASAPASRPTTSGAEGQQ